jgi:hypothetical protein
MSRILEVFPEMCHEALLVNGKFIDVLYGANLASIDKGRNLCDYQPNSSQDVDQFVHFGRGGRMKYPYFGPQQIYCFLTGEQR